MSYAPIDTTEQLAARVRPGKTPESLYLDFKGYGWRNSKKDEQAEELARDVAQFANTEGGTLLVGVKEREVSDGRRVASEIVGVEDVEGLAKWIEQAIRGFLVPATFAHHISPIRTADKTVLAVNVPPSIHLVALWHRTKSRGIEYVYRTSHGKEWMNPDEVEAHLMNGSRAAKLAVERICQQAGDRELELYPRVIARDLEVARLREFGPHDFEIRFAGTCGVRIPYGLVKEAWVTTEGRPALYLGARIARLSDRYSLDFER